jgi:predicted deacylase
MHDVPVHVRSRLVWMRLTIVVVWLAVIIPGAKALYDHRHYREAVVVGPGVTEIRRLSDYNPSVKGTVNDVSVYVMDSGVPGGTALILGGTHPEEPQGPISTTMFIENVIPVQGRLIVCTRANRSASTVTRAGDAYPQFFEIPTEFGPRRFRMGDRWSNPLDSWPDPEVYIHYPSKQPLAYMDIRNLNRVWPGRSNGTLTERTAAAWIDLINAENVDIVFDMHEAELEYSVISTIVAHERGADVAAMASMMLSATEFNMGMEYSPKKLHGLSHREIGDFTRALVFEIETPEPFLDRVRGVTDTALLLEGRDEFVMRAGAAGLLYEKIDEKGWPIDERVGRANSTVYMLIQMYNDMPPAGFDDRPIAFEGLPLHGDVVARGSGYYLRDPRTANQVVWE